MTKTLHTLAATALLSLFTTSAAAQPADVVVFHECDTTWHFGYGGVNIYRRDMHRIDIAYPSVDAHGDSLMLSGSIVIPSNIYDGHDPVDGVVLYNRYTQVFPEACPTRGFAEGEFVIMATPFEPNWILVESDFYGFGITGDRLVDQYYVYGDANGHASIDCLLAARRVLDARGIPQGKYLFNVGTSSGGYDAVATQRVRDMEFRERVSFDKTMVCELPFDVTEAFQQYIARKDDPAMVLTFAPLVAGCYNRNDSLGLTPEQLFSPALAEKYDSWFTYGLTNGVHGRDSVKKIATTMADVLSAEVLDTASTVYKTLRDAFERHALSNGWVPDASQPFFYMHYTKDNSVPVSSGRALLTFLSKHGYTKSLMPELTNLTTCMYIPYDNHVLCAVQFLLTVSATLAYYPVLYYDDELNTYFSDALGDGTPMDIVRRLEEKGVDLAAMLDDATGGSLPDRVNSLIVAVALNRLNDTFKEVGLTTAEVTQMASDSGLEISDMVKIINYLKSKTKSRETAATDSTSAAFAATDSSPTYSPAHSVPGSFAAGSPLGGFATGTAATPREAGTFSIMTLNVDGLPARFLSFDLNADGPQSEGSERISMYLAAQDVDIISMQEDFNYRWEIWSRLFAGYDHDEWTGGVGTEFKQLDWMHLQNERFPCDGLNSAWKTDIRSTAYERVAHNESFGKFSHAFDGAVTKGFRRHEFTLADGTEIVVYNTHFDASESRDERIGNDRRDRQARLSQWRQLRDHLMERLDSRPVILTGDFNSFYRSDSIRAVFFDPIEATGRATVGDAWIERCCDGIYPDGADGTGGDMLDKILYVNPVGGGAVEPVSATVDRTGYRYDGRPLGDHYPLTATFRVKGSSPAAITAATEEEDTHLTVHDLRGQHLEKLPMGGQARRIYIIDGQKVVR